MIRALLALTVALAGLSTVPVVPATTAAADPGEDLRAAARVNGMTATQLRQVLRDPTMQLDDDDQLFVADPLHDEAEMDRPVAATAQPVAPLEDTFELHSKPGSDKTIYLDFDGITLDAASAWVGSHWSAGAYDGIDTDGDRSTFGVDERALIQEVWARVSDDFVSFDVDVTTEDPTVDDPFNTRLVRTTLADTRYGMRVAITDDPDAKRAACEGTTCNIVGLAYVDRFDEPVGSGSRLERWGPAWVLSDFDGDAALTAETASHEVGHTLGLQHATTPAPTELFAPIMYPSISDAAVTHWVDNMALAQDQRAAITTAGGLSLRADDYPNTVPFQDTSRAGVISTPTDQDSFTLADCTSGPPTFTARPADAGPNLDIVLTVQPPTGSPVVAAPVTTAAGGMDASLTASSMPGTYVVTVEGGGSGEYSDYGSVGAYTLDVVGCGVPPVAPSAPRSVAATSVGTSTTVTWAEPATTGGHGSLTYQVSLDGGPWQASGGPSSHAFSTTPGRHRVSVRAVGGGDQAGPAVEVRSITAPATPISFWFEDHGTPGARYLHWELPPGGSGGAAAHALKLTAISPDPGLTWTLPSPSSGGYDWGTSLPDGSIWSGWLVNAAGESGRQRFVVRSTPVAPGAPTGLALSGTDEDAHTATVSWVRPLDDGGRPPGYEVRLDGGPWLPVADGESPYTFTGVSPGSRTAEVRTVTTAGTSAAAPLEFEMPGDPPPPGAPDGVTDVTATPLSSTSLQVSWAAPADNGAAIEHYTVQVGARTVEVGAPATTATVTGLAAGQTYAVSVTATNSVGTGSAGTTTATLPAAVVDPPGPPSPPAPPGPAPPAAVAPGVPTLQKPRPGPRGGAVTVRLAWRAPATDGGASVTSYRIVGYVLDKRGRVTGQRTWSVTASRLKIELKVRKGVRMRFAIQATNAAGWSPLGARSRPVTGR